MTNYAKETEMKKEVRGENKIPWPLQIQTLFT